MFSLFALDCTTYSVRKFFFANKCVISWTLHNCKRQYTDQTNDHWIASKEREREEKNRKSRTIPFAFNHFTFFSSIALSFYFSFVCFSAIFVLFLPSGLIYIIFNVRWTRFSNQMCIIYIRYVKVCVCGRLLLPFIEMRPFIIVAFFMVDCTISFVVLKWNWHFWVIFSFVSAHTHTPWCREKRKGDQGEKKKEKTVNK